MTYDVVNVDEMSLEKIDAAILQQFTNGANLFDVAIAMPADHWQEFVKLCAHTRHLEHCECRGFTYRGFPILIIGGEQLSMAPKGAHERAH